MDEKELLAFKRRMLLAKAPAWIAEPGDTFVGELIGVTERDSGWGPYPCMTYQSVDSGQVYNVHAFHTLLRDRMEELKANTGDVHIIHYVGVREKNAPNAKGEKESYHDYYVEKYGDVVEQ